MDLVVLFLSAFAASTVIPMSSEAVLAAITVSSSADPLLLVTVATAGNTLGATLNWGIGRYAATWRGRLTWFPETKFRRASRWFQRWGVWSLLLSWLPVVGDPPTLIAGLLRTPFIPFFLLVVTGKAVRYLVVVLAASSVQGFFAGSPLS